VIFATYVNDSFAHGDSNWSLEHPPLPCRGWAVILTRPVLKPPLIKGKIRCLNTSKEYTYGNEVCQKLMQVDRPVKWAKLGAVPMKFF
jgi:hypothetical protein